MRYIVTAQLEIRDTDDHGIEWTGSYGLPAFEIVAGNPANAESIALLILGPAGERPDGVAWHLGIEPVVGPEAREIVEVTSPLGTAYIDLHEAARRVAAYYGDGLGITVQDIVDDFRAGVGHLVGGAEYALVD